ncbi:radical SAM protein [Oceanirhabdus sp. W0125-5]|uniref:radical SAM protein n=1 Tax=Oceanirhabdus sp. W0125-5 TaxID=2999116 RepID=UPI0022F2B8D8|nr:radical SAM protein [Oceanirhabdus sp. W0125-5]WBW94929.1 radical SAM protein [Oceanirhabdus sp. W0125-5]
MKKINFKVLYIEITHFCNQSCKHCYLDCSSEKELYPMNTQEIKKIITDFKNQGGWYVVLTGGEPFARKDIFEILDCIEENNLKFNVASNCLALNEEKIKKLGAYKCLDVIHTSILGSNEEEHNYISNSKGYNNVLRCLKLFEKYNIKVYIQITLAKEYIDKMEYIVDNLSEINGTIKFTPITNLGIKKDDYLYEKLVIKEEDYSRFYDKYNKLKEKYGELIEHSNLFTYEEVNKEIEYFKDKELYSLDYRCLVVRPDGEKSFSFVLNNPVSYGSALEGIEVDMDDRLIKYIDTLREVDKEILKIAKDKGMVNYDVLMNNLIEKAYANNN